MEIKDLIKKIFFGEIINEAKSGEVKIEIENETHTFNVGFNACIEGVLESGNFGDSKPVLMINNKEQLINLLEQYFNECDKHQNKFSDCKLETKIKIYLTILWSNATYEDFANPLSFINKRIDFYQDLTLDFISKNYSEEIEVLDGSKIRVYNELQDIRQETPFIFKPTIEKGENIFELPNISYGISNGECYIYAIQQKRKKELTNYDKKINRKLYKINSGILDSETNEYKEYLNGENYYPENISEVSPSAILSLIIFLNILNEAKIEKLKVVSLLPIRYNSKELAFSKKYEFQLKYSNLNEPEIKKLLLEYKKENLRIQQNLSEKMIRNFRRVEYHFNNCLITAYPMEFDEYLHMTVREFSLGNNEFLNEIISAKKLEISK